MRVFTDDEKQQLQAKIEDERERQRVLKEIIQVESEKEAKRSKGIISTVFSFKYGFLVLIFFLLVWSVDPLMKWQNFDRFQFSSLVVPLMLLFNHVAWHFTKKGRLSRVMKTIALIWAVCGCAYLFWLF